MPGLTSAMHAPAAGDPLIGDLRRAGLLPLLVLHYLAAEDCYGNQLMERIAALTERRDRREPEHDVPAAALARGAGARARRVGASGAALQALLPRSPTRAGRSTSASRAEVAPRLDRIAGSIEAIRDEVAPLMGRATASIRVPGRASDAEALWYDPHALARLGRRLRATRARVPEAWPAGGHAAVGQPPRRPRARARGGRRLRGARSARRCGWRTSGCAAPSGSRSAPPPSTCWSALELDYELKERTPVTPIVDRLFVRRELTASLRRTPRRLRPRAARGYGVGGRDRRLG